MTATWNDITEAFLIRACVRSGMCCKSIACAFGTWDARRHQCTFLLETEHGPGYTVYACGKKAEIEALPEYMRADINPAFGAGCCMPMFNTNRKAILAHQAKQRSSK